MKMLTLTLKEKHRAGKSPWIFSNDVEHLDDSVLDSGRCALVQIASLKRVGIYDKSSLISVRLFSSDFNFLAESPDSIDPSVFSKIISKKFVLLKEEKLSLGIPAGEAFRLVHGESDGIPGIVIDDYGSFFSIQSSSAAGDFLIEAIHQALVLFEDKPVLERSSGQARRMSNLPERTRWLSNAVKMTETVTTEFCELKLAFSPLKAQKTGLFLDQRNNLQRLKAYYSGSDNSSKAILDICSYVGAWSAMAAKAGFQKFCLIDQDKSALEKSVRNVSANAVVANSTIETLHGDLFEHLAVLGKAQAEFDLVVADPPAFAKSKKHIPEAKIAYSRLTKQASKLVKAGGLYVACSCSRNLEDQEFLEIVSKNLVGDGWVFLEKGNQSPDHTISASDSISEYLKCFYFRKRKLGKKLDHGNS